MELFRHLENVFRTDCLQSGYEEIRTPTLEYLHLFTAAGTLTPARLNRVYSFLDWDGWSGERVVLRPDGTIPVARLYVSSLHSRGLVRLFYVENTFIFESTGKEPRERWQCGAELVGTGSPLGDVELILLAGRVLQKLGVAVEVHLSHAGLVRGLLRELGVDPSQELEVFDQLLNGDDSSLKRMGDHGPLKKFVEMWGQLRGDSPGFLSNLKTLLPPGVTGLEPALDDLTLIAEMLTATGCRYYINLLPGEGFEYYTGAIFHLYVEGERVGGGGRYDQLIPLIGGQNVPASGFALYMDRLMELMPPLDAVATVRKVLVKLGKKDAHHFQEGLLLAQLLREVGHTVEVELASGDESRYRWVVSLHEGKGGNVFRVTHPGSFGHKDVRSPAEVATVLEAEWS